ncbi:exonuclease mut-7 homolog [Drosophila guanche]|uniref:Blast:Exonuclease mut-7 homolog n=1 Tax=Drosophila guanche TaxID=7266 RepID=A0A3B0K954_DROGU|nr:exonuclease mut-7 homolog [Drosophila guanche]SPP82156.1 blast:Exonuclease mut-7 homolog [Drosophila guanche]
MAKKMYNAIPGGFEDDEDELEHYMTNLKIKRLENITTGAGINGTNFDATLDAEAQEFFTVFREKWNMYSNNKSPHLGRDLGNALKDHKEPLLLALKIFANCPDCSNIKPKSLSHFVLDKVCKLHQDYPQLDCDENTSMIAFNFVKNSGVLSLNNAIIKAYRLHQIRQLLLPKLREMLDAGQYKEVAQWAISLQMAHEFDMLELAFPLIAQEKLPLAEVYLDQATSQRLPFVKFLDSLLHKDKSVFELCEPILDRYKNLKVSHNVLSYRPMSKMVSRLAKKYGFDDGVTPNFKFTKTCGYLHYLFREYEKSRINLASFREMVSVHASDHALQVEFVIYVAGAQDSRNEAVYWYKEFKLKPKDFPHDIISQISRGINEEEAPQTSDDNGATSSGIGCDMYLTMDLPDDCLLIVDTASQFQRMLGHLKREHIIYMDSEWVQNVCGDCQLCLLQIATVRNVYLIDCLARQSITANHWRALGADVFNNMNILKVGFSMYSDLMVLQRSLPLQLRLLLAHHYLDLRSLWLELKKQRFGIELPFGNVNRAGDALSDLSLVCLGKKLNKSNQCSNWANRPLRREQILYAAIDARCLMLIYNTLLNRVPNINVLIDKSIASNNFLKRGGNANVK